MMHVLARGRLRMAAAIALTLLSGSYSRTAPASDGTLYVIVSAHSSVQSLTHKEVLALYTGRSRAFPDGQTANPLDQSRDGAARASFYQLLTGMDIARINSYWARLHFTGQVKPPKAMPDERSMLEQVKRDPLAVGYLTYEPRDSAVRVVLRLP